MSELRLEDVTKYAGGRTRAGIALLLVERVIERLTPPAMVEVEAIARPCWSWVEGAEVPPEPSYERYGSFVENHLLVPVASKEMVDTLNLVSEGLHAALWEMYHLGERHIDRFPSDMVEDAEPPVTNLEQLAHDADAVDASFRAGLHALRERAIADDAPISAHVLRALFRGGRAS